MRRRSLPILTLLLLGVSGCLTDQQKTEMVSNDPFGRPAPVPPSPQTQAGNAPSALDAAARVDQSGRRLVAANKQAGIQPLFRTIGAPQPEIFHRGTTEIDITEGLVKQCATDSQLAAVLCVEMGKMVSEREALAAPRLRVPEGLPPMEVQVGNDGGGLFGPADQLHHAELAKYEQEHPRKPANSPPPDPQALAKAYMTRAGYPVTDIDAVVPLLRAAGENNTFAKQITSPPPAPR